MRLLLSAMFVMLAVPAAHACPQGTICVAAVTRSVERAEARARTPAVAREITPRSMLQVAIAHASRVPERDRRLTRSLATHVAPRPQTIEMPWIWVQLRASVYSQLPRYDRPTRRPENQFSLVLSPVVVSSLQDTVPGVGVEGGF